MDHARRFGALLAILLLTACGAVNPGSGPGSAPASANPSAASATVTGTLQRGTVPTCPAGEPCDPPNASSTLVFSRPGLSDVTVRLAADGSFSIQLEPGSYSIAAQPPPFNGRVEPSTVRVPQSGTVELKLRIVPSAA